MTGLRIRTWQADGLLLSVTAVWGATFPLVKNATDLAAGGVPIYWFLAARFTLATLLLAAFFGRRLRNLPATTWKAGGLLGLFLFAGYALQTFGLAHTSSAKAGFITGLCVAIVPVLTVVWLKRKPTPGAWVGVLAASVGLGLLSLNADLIPTYGDFLVFLCAIAFALHIVGISRYGSEHDTVALAVIQIGTAALLSWVMHLIERGTLAPGVARVDWLTGPGQVVLAVLICGVLATAAAFLLMNVLQPYTTPTHAALIYSAEPVWGAIFAYFIAGETLTGRGYFGAALILAGMILVELPIGRRSGPQVAEGD